VGRAITFLERFSRRLSVVAVASKAKVKVLYVIQKPRGRGELVLSNKIIL